MKTLYLVRHAKSSWDDISLGDFDRPLNERGKADAPRMGKRLKDKNIHPNVMISSGAKRAHATAKRIAEVLNFPKDAIKTDRTLYHAEPEQILEVIKAIADMNDSVMVFGHNPGLTDFVNQFGSDVEIDNIPTCGIVALRFQIDSWNKLSPKSGILLFFDYPKSRQD
jgi:phosphohistidine phosphatase